MNSAIKDRFVKTGNPQDVSTERKRALQTDPIGEVLAHRAQFLETNDDTMTKEEAEERGITIFQAGAHRQLDGRTLVLDAGFAMVDGRTQRIDQID